MALPVALESLKAEALQTSCAAWAIRARWKLVKATATELVGPCPVCGGTDRCGSAGDDFAAGRTRNEGGLGEPGVG